MEDRRLSQEPAGDALPSSPGIYMLWFDGLNSGYIGSSKNIAKRVAYHLGQMRYSWHKMNEDLRSYGAGALRISVLETIDDLDDLPEAETYWLQQYRAGGWYLYNAEMRGKGHRDRVVTR